MEKSIIKTFEKFNKIDPYGEEIWNPVEEQEITSMNNIYLCTRNYENHFIRGYVYIIWNINQNVIGPNIVDTRTKVIGENIDEFININFNNGNRGEEDPYMQAQVDRSLIFVGKLER
jgi:hypothetical protein